MNKALAKPLKMGVLSIGRELLEGRVGEAHARFVSQRLSPLGYHISIHLTAGDDPGSISNLLQANFELADIWIVSGGLGPTVDDRTREELADFMKVPLIFDSEMWEHIKAYIQSKVGEVPKCNRQQAFKPKGSTLKFNTHGTAPAIRIPTHRGVLWTLPGVPREFHALFKEWVQPDLLRNFPVPNSSRSRVQLRFFGVSEAKLDEWLQLERPAVSDEERATDYHICAEDGEILVQLPGESSEWQSKSREKFAVKFLGSGCESLTERLVQVAKKSGVQLAAAESCTGGQISALITATPGCSQIWRGSAVSYGAEAKQRLLGLPAELIQQHGEVSAVIAGKMAEAARGRFGADFAISTTGVAGPDPLAQSETLEGEPFINPGTVFFGLATAQKVYTRKMAFFGDRSRIQNMAAKYAIFVLWQCTNGELPHGFA